MRLFHLTVTAAVLLGACGPPYSPPVPVQGEAARLEGRWTGEFENPMLGRSGSIEFVLQPGVDTAQGSVLMIPSQEPQRIRGTRWWEPASVNMGPQLLTVRMVMVEGNRVTGRLEPYRDPESGTMVVTTFTGYLEGNTISGKFFTVDDLSGWAVEGQWKVTRQ
jgi:hypothetical protein